MVDDICVILKDFSNMMQEFGVSEYRACATSAFREIVNPVIVQEQIYQRTGIRIEILSNAEQHFLGYKSIAAIESGFRRSFRKEQQFWMLAVVICRFRCLIKMRW